MDMDFKALLRKPGGKPALIIGNGVNLYDSADGTSNWRQLLLQLWRNNIGSVTKEALEGISLTEFYDALDLKVGKSSKSLHINKIC